MKELKGKTAFVSGGAEGIGYYIARCLGQEGMNVMVGDIDAKILEGAVKTLKGEGLSVESIVFDVALRDDWERAAKKTIDTFGKAHLLVGNAGVAVTGAQKNYTEGDWRWIIDVNFMSIVYGTQAFYPLFKSHNEGAHFMNVASIAGIHGVSFSGPYCSTKAAVVSLSECYRKEFEKDGIEVSVLCPGFVKSRVYDSKRNKQARYGGPEHYEDIIKTKPAQKYNKELCVTGIDTDIAGRRAVEGLKNGEFYIFTHPHYRELHEFRMKNITKGFDDADASPELANVPRKGVIIY